jgi:N-acetylglucosamine-6-phosphate deacetylase
MRINDVLYYGEDFRFHFGDVTVEDGRFEHIEEKENPGQKSYNIMIPGLVDIHLHGNSGEDFSDGNYDGLVRMARFLADAGTTSFSPASMTLPEEIIAAACRSAVKLRDETPRDCASIRGITMEGPFFSEKKKGAQNAAYLRKPDAGMFKRMQQDADNMIRIACVAPELEGAKDYIREVSVMGVTVTAAHTGATYDEAAAGFDAGITHVTHLFNGMPPLLHREPGVIGAASERDNVTVELICDGIHVHPSAVRAAFKLFGASRICLVSDAMAACGLENGESMLGGQKVYVKDGRATLADGTIAGSVATLFECVKTALSMGISPEDAVRCATVNPARVIGADDIGSIATGRRADFLLCGRDWALKDVYMAGNKLERT